MMINLKIDNQSLALEEELTILQAAEQLGMKIPTLCYNKYLKPYGGCRICLVEMAYSRAPDRKKLVPACSTIVEQGMIITTGSERVFKARSFIFALLLHRCPDSAELIDFGREFGFNTDRENPRNVVQEYLYQRSEPPDYTKCILCGLCVRVCAEITERHALCYYARGIKRKVKTPFNRIAERCIGCASCAYVCPMNTITVEEAI